MFFSTLNVLIVLTGGLAARGRRLRRRLLLGADADAEHERGARNGKREFPQIASNHVGTPEMKENADSLNNEMRGNGEVGRLEVGGGRLARESRSEVGEVRGWADVRGSERELRTSSLTKQNSGRRTLDPEPALVAYFEQLVPRSRIDETRSVPDVFCELSGELLADDDEALPVIVPAVLPLVPVGFVLVGFELAVSP